MICQYEFNSIHPRLKHYCVANDLQRHELLTLQAVSYSHNHPASKYDIAHSYRKCYITNELLMSEPQLLFGYRKKTNTLVFSWYFSTYYGAILIQLYFTAHNWFVIISCKQDFNLQLRIWARQSILNLLAADLQIPTIFCISQQQLLFTVIIWGFFLH